MIKAILGDTLAYWLYRLGFSKPNTISTGKLTVVTFHRVLTEEQRKQYPYPGLAVTPDELEWLLGHFSKHYFCGSLTRMYQKWISSDTLEKPPLAITFDDGQVDNFENAKPVIDKYRILATFYIPVHHIEGNELIWHDRLGFSLMECLNRGNAFHRDIINTLSPFRIIPNFEIDTVNQVVQESKKLTPVDRAKLIVNIEKIIDFDAQQWAFLMSWEQIKQLTREGHEIGSHTMNHALLPQLNDEDLEIEINHSRKILKEKTNTAINSFCFPNGDYDARSIKVVEKSGYSNAVTTRWGINARGVKRFEISRCDINTFYLRDRNNQLSFPRLMMRLGGFHPGLR